MVWIKFKSTVSAWPIPLDLNPLVIQISNIYHRIAHSPSNPNRGITILSSPNKNIMALVTITSYMIWSDWSAAMGTNIMLIRSNLILYIHIT
jgi:hypothetical protein